MSVSPPIRRLSSSASSSKGQEDLINAYEAEEERIINHLSRKLEQVCVSRPCIRNEEMADELSRLSFLPLLLLRFYVYVTPSAYLPDP